MFRAHGAAIAGKAGYILCCIVASLVLVMSGFADYVMAQVISIGGSDVILGGPSVGAMNILPMGWRAALIMAGTPAGRPPRRDARRQRAGRGVRRCSRSGHEHADPHPHLRGRAEGGRLLDPARRLGDLPQGV